MSALASTTLQCCARVDPFELFCDIVGGSKEQKAAGVEPFCALLFTVQESRKQLQGLVYVDSNVCCTWFYPRVWLELARALPKRVGQLTDSLIVVPIVSTHNYQNFLKICQQLYLCLLCKFIPQLPVILPLIGGGILHPHPAKSDSFLQTSTTASQSEPKEIIRL